MTTQEFSNQFDTLVSAYYNNSNLVSFDEYEKSVFLTEAQEEIVLELYNGKNSFGESFESTEELRRFISNLIDTYTTNTVSIDTGLSSNSYFFSIPDNVWFITYESVILIDNEEAIVTPITQDEFYKIQKNPFRGPNKNRVLRLDIKDNKVELISKYNITSYIIRYLVKPNPIILVDLDNLSINGISNITECNLNPILHRIILDRAIKKAIASRIPINNIKE